MFVITFIDNHRVNTEIYSTGIGLSFSHKFHKGLIDSAQWTSTHDYIWTESISKAVNMSQSVVVRWPQLEKPVGCVSVLLQSPQPLTFSTVTFHCEISVQSLPGALFTLWLCVLPLVSTRLTFLDTLLVKDRSQKKVNTLELHSAFSPWYYCVTRRDALGCSGSAFQAHVFIHSILFV